jgi:hypothetical protein
VNRTEMAAKIVSHLLRRRLVFLAGTGQKGMDRRYHG